MDNVLITGVTGQDGAFLARMLINAGYNVFGTVRRGSTPKFGRLEYLGILDKVKRVPVELTEFSSIFNVIRDVRPKYIYNLAAQSFVADSFNSPHYTSLVNYISVLHILEAIRAIGLEARLYQASTSEMFGAVLETPQKETTPFNPLSPYGVSKCAAHMLVNNYRLAYGMNCASGILFNHESELRGREFVTRKITLGLSKLKYCGGAELKLGNLDAVRDWGYAEDYVEGMVRIINAQKMDDYVLATGEATKVRDFLSQAAIQLGFRPEFEGEGKAEVCIDGLTGSILASVDETFYRPSDVNFLLGDPTKVKKELDWKPTVSLEEMVARMVACDSDLVQAQGLGF